MDPQSRQILANTATRKRSSNELSLDAIRAKEVGRSRHLGYLPPSERGNNKKKRLMKISQIFTNMMRYTHKQEPSHTPGRRGAARETGHEKSTQQPPTERDPSKSTISGNIPRSSDETPRPVPCFSPNNPQPRGGIS